MRKPFRRNDLLGKAAVELGHIVMEWSLVERALDEMIELLAPIERGQVSQIITGNTDIRGKVQMVKGLAFLRGFDDVWRDDTIFLLDYIDNDIRPRRNAVIHADWGVPTGRLQRRSRKTKLVRPQARQLVLETEQAIPVKISELQALSRDMQLTVLGTMQLYWFMQGEDDQYVDPATSPTISYKQYLRWAGLGNPVREIRSRLQRQRRSSQR